MSSFLNNLEIIVNGKMAHNINYHEIFDENKIFKLWPATQCFSTYLANFPLKFEGKTILELGSGVGVLGIVNISLIFTP